MSCVQQVSITQHQARLEDPEEPFVSDDWADICDFQGWGIMDAGSAEIFNGAVDRTSSNKGGGYVEGSKNGVQV